ncbi:MAG: glycosyltransferase [Myxococcales bacterium]|nr:glycosyltransferase [Myxococcales bacterium]
MARIAFVSLHNDPAWTTPERFILGDVTRAGLAMALARRGWTVDVIVEAGFRAGPVEQRSPEEGVVRWHFCPPGVAVRSLRSLARLAGDPDPQIRAPGLHVLATLRACRPEIVHSFDLVFYPHLLALGSLGVPLIAHFHGGAAARRPGWRLAERAALSRVQRLLFTTTAHAEGWIANGYPRAQVRAVLETSVRGAAPAPKMGRIRGGRILPILVCVGRLDAVKDPLTTLRGFEWLLETHPDAVLHLCWTDAPLHAEVLAHAARLGPAVRLHGRLDHAATLDLIRGADVLVQSSTREVCGVAVLEAMALGTPPVVTDIPAFRQILGDTGARFAPGDAAGLAMAIRRVLAEVDPGARCQARFHTELSFEALSEQVEGVYRELVAAG